MNEHLGTSLKTVYETFIISQSSKGVSEATIKNYHSHLKGIAKHLDIGIVPFGGGIGGIVEITETDLAILGNGLMDSVCIRHHTIVHVTHTICNIGLPI